MLIPNSSSVLIQIVRGQGSLTAGNMSRKVELLQVGRRIGDETQYWDPNGNNVPARDQIKIPWRPDDKSTTGYVDRYLHIIYRVKAEPGDKDPTTGVGSPRSSSEYVRPGIAMGYASSDLLYTKDGWHYFVDHLSLSPVDPPENLRGKVIRDPSLNGVKDLGHRYMGRTTIGITFTGSAWNDRGSISDLSSVKKLEFHPARQLPAGFGMEKRSKTWTQAKFQLRYNRGSDDQFLEYDAYLTDGKKLSYPLVMGSFGSGFDERDPNLLNQVYYVAAAPDQIKEIHQRTRPGFQGDLEVPLSPNSDNRNWH
jgi:hypothetical protein